MLGLSTGLDHALERLASLGLHLGSDAFKGWKRKSEGMHRWQCKALADLCLDKERSTLVPTILVFLEDGRMVLAGVLTAFLHHGHEWAKLSPSITGIVYMGWSLRKR